MRTPKIIVFLGPPGAGKGTQAARLSAAFEIPAISTGEMLRRESQSGSELGRRLEAVLRAGHLVADEQMNQLVEARLREEDCRNGCILDGYPRTIQQAAYLDALLERLGANQPVVLNFVVCAEQLIDRLKRRRQCPSCGRIYSAENSSSSAPLLCLNDRSLLIPRPDDQPAVIRERLRIHEANSADLVRYYQGRDYHRISAGNSTEEVTGQMFQAVGLSRVPSRFSPLSTQLSASAAAQ